MELKVGDKLAFRIGYRGDYQLASIEKITKTCRIKCGQFELNPDLTVRGRSGYSSPYRAELVTEEILLEIRRVSCKRFLQDVKWASLTDETLFEIVKLVKKDKANGIV